MKNSEIGSKCKHHTQLCLPSYGPVNVDHPIQD